MDADLWRRAALLFIPFGGCGDQLAVGVTAGDVGHHGRRQYRRLVQRLAACGDDAFVLEGAQDALELDAVGILQPEFARDLPRADLARLRTDEGEDRLRRRKALLARF